MKSAIGQGKKLEDLVEKKGQQTRENFLQLPDSVRHWVGPSLPAQVRDTYEEITQGKPHGEIMGGK